VPGRRRDAKASRRDGDTLIGAPAVNAPKLLLTYRRMIADRVRWEDALLAC
jgi:hypothetical protein